MDSITLILIFIHVRLHRRTFQQLIPNNQNDLDQVKPLGLIKREKKKSPILTTVHYLSSRKKQTECNA